MFSNFCNAESASLAKGSKVIQLPKPLLLLKDSESCWYGIIIIMQAQLSADQEPGDDDEDEARHQLHEHAVEPQVDGQHVVGGDPGVLQAAKNDKNIGKIKKEFCKRLRVVH